ncbi:hypothetical protein SIL82_15630 [Sphingomonas echinoides]|uniref:Uncharacterized protein n=2 Tax=Sphingomonas echinoides TaxID=59803 RepID=A0ABU4PNG1_9SPHN|nr:hypothetical protein [Sphingomonas echinoides]MDX5985685.1 hypothetical protein [Sphingomonas echinoides]
MKLRLHSKADLGIGLGNLAIGGLNFTHRNSPYGYSWDRYMWLFWLLIAGIWIYRAFRPGRSAN